MTLPSGEPWPQHSPPPMYGPPPARRGLLVAWVAGAAIVVLLAAAVTALYVLRSDDGKKKNAGTGPVDLRQPMEFRQVTQSAPPPCAAGTSKDLDGSACYLLAADAMTVRRVEDMAVQFPDAATGQMNWGVSISLTPADAPLFAQLSTKASGQSPPANQVAIIVGGQVLSAPTISSPITGGKLTITGPNQTFTRPYVEALIRRMTGRT